MKYLAAGFVGLIVISAWLAGIVLAKGFWLTFLAIVLPFYAWYLVAEKIMQIIGVI